MSALEMTTFTLVALLPWLVVLALALWRRRVRRDDAIVATSVLVQLVDGSALAGVLVKRVGKFYVIENARLLENGAEVDVDGAAWLPAERVRWLQVEGGRA